MTEIFILTGVSSVFVGVFAKFFLDKDFFPWFLYGVLLLPIAFIHLVVRCFQSSNKLSQFGGLVSVCLMFGWAYLFYNYLTGFNTINISEVESSIKSEFEKKDGVKVKSVKMIKENNSKLFGVAVIEFSGLEVSKSCSATMAQGSYNYIWQCN